MLPAEIRERAEAIRLGKKELSDLSGLSERTTGQIMREQRSPRLDNLQALERALLAQELSLRDYLIALHGVPPADGASS